MEYRKLNTGISAARAMTAKPQLAQVLVVNDDGPDATGLVWLAEVMAENSEPFICVPTDSWPASSRSFGPTTLTGGATRALIAGMPAYLIDATPSGCVAHGVLRTNRVRPTLCVAGVNLGTNLGFGLGVSGTVGAAFEAASYGLRAIAISLDASAWPTDGTTIDGVKSTIRRVLEHVESNPWPTDVSVLNVNIPAHVRTDTDIVWTRPSRQNYIDFIESKLPHLGEAFSLRTTVAVDHATLEHDSDIMALLNRRVSISPLGWNPVPSSLRGLIGSTLSSQDLPR